MMLDAAHGKSMKVMRIAMRSGRAQIRGRSPLRRVRNGHPGGSLLRWLLIHKSSHLGPLAARCRSSHELVSSVAS